MRWEGISFLTREVYCLISSFTGTICVCVCAFPLNLKVRFPCHGVAVQCVCCQQVAVLLCAGMDITQMFCWLVSPLAS